MVHLLHCSYSFIRGKIRIAFFPLILQSQVGYWQSFVYFLKESALKCQGCVPSPNAAELSQLLMFMCCMWEFLEGPWWLPCAIQRGFFVLSWQGDAHCWSQWGTERCGSVHLLTVGLPDEGSYRGVDGAFGHVYRSCSLLLRSPGCCEP